MADSAAGLCSRALCAEGPSALRSPQPFLLQSSLEPQYQQARCRLGVLSGVAAARKKRKRRKLVELLRRRTRPHLFRRRRTALFPLPRCWLLRHVPFGARSARLSTSPTSNRLRGTGASSLRTKQVSSSSAQLRLTNERTQSLCGRRAQGTAVSARPRGHFASQPCARPKPDRPLRPGVPRAKPSVSFERQS